MTHPRTRLLVCLTVALAWSVTAQAAIVTEITGPGGRIEGSSTLSGEEGNIDTFGYFETVTQPHDPVTGLPTGNRVYSPVTITKMQDKATVPLHSAMINADLLDVHVRFYVLGQQQTNYYTVVLQGAHLVSITSSSDEVGPPVETLLFTFDKIIWTDETTNITEQDTWTGGPSNVLANRDPGGILMPPTPNPSSYDTLLRFELPASSPAELTVYDLRGRRVRELYNDRTPSERIAVSWNGMDDFGRRVASGVYLVKLKWPEGETHRRVALVQ